MKSLYALPTWTRTARLIREHAGLQDALGGAPSEWSLYRFTAKLRAHSDKLADCLDRIAASLAEALPELGQDVAVDGSDLPGYSNGQRYIYDGGPEREKFSDGDASWGHRSAVGTRSGGGFFGFKLHLAACARTGLPLAWQVETGRMNESQFVGSLLDKTRARGFAAETCALDRGYDVGPVYDACEERDCRPVVPLRNVGKPHELPSCEHGTWVFAGADFKRKRSKWRCPSGACSPKSKWIAADRRNPLVPRHTRRWRDLYWNRTAVEREFGRLKNDYALTPLRTRGIERVRLHADLTMLARLSQALARARAVPLAA